MAEDSNLPYSTPESKHLTLSKYCLKWDFIKEFFKSNYLRMRGREEETIAGKIL